MQKKVVESKAPMIRKPEQQFGDLLFTTCFNTPLNSQIISDAIKRMVNDINTMRDVTDEIEVFSCHCFRHTFATRCFESGIKPKNSSKIFRTCHPSDDDGLVYRSVKIVLII